MVERLAGHASSWLRAAGFDDRPCLTGSVRPEPSPCSSDIAEYLLVTIAALLWGVDGTPSQPYSKRKKPSQLGFFRSLNYRETMRNLNNSSRFQSLIRLLLEGRVIRTAWLKKTGRDYARPDKYLLVGGGYSTMVALADFDALRVNGWITPRSGIWVATDELRAFLGRTDTAVPASDTG